MGWTTGVQSLAGAMMEFFLNATASRPELESNQPPIQWLPGALSSWVRWPGREANHSPPSSVVVKNKWNYISNSPVFLHSMVLN